MKKIIVVLIGIFLIAGVIAGGVVLVSDASFTPEQPKEKTRYTGEITFKCGGESMSVYLDEPNMDIDDDFEMAVAQVCDGVVSDVVDWVDRKYKQIEVNGETYRSFNESYLNSLNVEESPPEEDELNETNPIPE
jgi:hypothetical protein